MDRKQLCDLLLNEINETSTNDYIIERVQNVLQKLEWYIEEHYRAVGFSFDSIDNSRLLGLDLAEAIQDIVKCRLYYAVTRIWDFLLKGKSYDLPVGAYELYITRIVLKGLLMSWKTS